MKKIVYLVLLVLCVSCQQKPDHPQLVDEFPPIFPDYLGVTVPSDIAPLNFNFNGNTECEVMDVTVKGEDGTLLNANGAWADFDLDDWHNLLAKNQGKKLTVTVCTKEDGQWKQYKDFEIQVSPYELGEYGLTYRRIAPGYEVYSKMGLYERNLSDFEETAIFENTEVARSCVNCHTSNKTSATDFLFHVRGDHGATVIQTQGKMEVLNTQTDQTLGFCVYPYWHPSGKYVAFSTNTTRQSFHVSQKELIEVFDQASDLQVYNTETHELILSDLLKGDNQWETFPAFSPDGKTLYFCTADPKPIPEQYQEIRYNLCKISFDAEKGKLGEKIDTLVYADKMGKSATFPRPSYDGKYLMYTLADYGTFPIWHKEADLWMMDLKTGETQILETLNSADTDSFHNWSKNSHWVVFSSRRGNGLYTRLYLACCDENGKFSKPFLLPQKNPWEYYDELLDSYNTPDFVEGPVSFDAHQAGSVVASDKRIDLKVKK